MRKHLVSLSAAAALTLGGPAMADGMSYSYVQADLLGSQLDANFSSISGAGFGLNGSVELGSHLYAFGGYKTNKYTGNGVRFRFIPASAGLGLHVPLGSLDIFGGPSIERLKVRFRVLGFAGSSYSQSFDGWGFGLGLRGWIGGSFQWSGGLKYRDMKDFQSLTSITLAGHYFFSPRLALGMGFTYQKYDNFLLYARDSVGSLNFRYSFGTPF